jgi:hypothetical protein
VIDKTYRTVRLKAAVRARDGYRCRGCGMTADEHRAIYGRTLEVHRIAPGSPYTPDGCVTLCKTCHKAQPKSPRGTGPRRYQVAVDLSPEQHARLRVVAAVKGVSMSVYARQVLEKAIEADYPAALEDKPAGKKGGKA